MKNKIFLFLFLSFSFAKAQRVFDKLLSSPFPYVSQYNINLSECANHDLLITGSYTNMKIIRTDSAANPLWNLIVDSVYAVSSLETTQGNIISLGYYNKNFSATFPYLIKTNSSGSLQWKKPYNYFPFKVTPKVFKQTNDGGFLIMALAENTSSDFSLQLIKTDNNGDTLWNKNINYKPSEIEYWNDIIVLPTNDFMVIGNNSGLYGQNGTILTFDSNGTQIGAKDFVKPNSTTIPSYDFSKIIAVSSGGFIVGGSSAYVNLNSQLIVFV